MPRRRLGLSLVLAMGLAVVSLSAGGRSTPEARRLRLEPIAATTNHAAVVIDTGQEVKKFCLAFPEDEISGADALRRVDAQVQFASFSSRGQAVCSLCGTGCPSSNCFCDPNRFWAYHRAGPGGAPYAFSRTGASATTVRNGDVEGWKWGAGEAPPAAKVSEICDVEEPPARAAGAPASTPTSSTPPTSSSQPAATTTTSPGTPLASPAPAGAVPPTSTAPSSGPRAPGVAPAGRPASPEGPGATVPPGAPVDVAPAEPDAGVREAPVDEPGSSSEGSIEALGTGRNDPAPTPSSNRGTVAAFAALLGGVLVWRARLRRAKVRSEGLGR